VHGVLVLLKQTILGAVFFSASLNWEGNKKEVKISSYVFKFVSVFEFVSKRF